MSRILAAVAAAVLFAPGCAGAAEFGFSDPAPVGTGPLGETAAALTRDGEALLAATAARGSGDESVRAWSRARSGAPWTADAIAGRLTDARDVQAAFARDGDRVVAWAQINSASSRVAYAIQRPGGTLRQTGSFPVRSAYAARPRLAVLDAGVVLLAYRDGPTLRVARRAPRATRFAPSRPVATDVSSLAIAPAGVGATVLWRAARARADAPHPLRAVRLDDAGRAVARVELVAHDALAPVRLSGRPAGRAIASWIRPGGRNTGGSAAFTRSLAPDDQRARPFFSPGPQVRAPTVTQDADGIALGVIAGFEPGTPGFEMLVATSRSGGVWTRAEKVGGPAPMVGDPRPALIGPRRVIAFTQARTEPGPASYDVVVAERGDGDGPIQTGVLDRGVTTTDGRGLVLAQASTHLLLAWPAPDGGWHVSERG